MFTHTYRFARTPLADRLDRMVVGAAAAITGAVLAVIGAVPLFRIGHRMSVAVDAWREAPAGVQPPTGFGYSILAYALGLVAAGLVIAAVCAWQERD